jgi:two-component system response regulator DesR
MTPPIRVLLAEDNEDLSEAVVALLGFHPEIECVGVAPTLDRVLSDAAAKQAHVVVLDVELGGESSLKKLPVLRSTLPQATFVMFSGHSHPELIKAARAAGAVDYVVKSAGLDALINAIRAAAPPVL